MRIQKLVAQSSRKAETQDIWSWRHQEKPGYNGHPRQLLTPPQLTAATFLSPADKQSYLQNFFTKQKCLPLSYTQAVQVLLAASLPSAHRCN